MKRSQPINSLNPNQGFLIGLEFKSGDNSSTYHQNCLYLQLGENFVQSQFINANNMVLNFDLGQHKWLQELALELDCTSIFEYRSLQGTYHLNGTDTALNATLSKVFGRQKDPKGNMFIITGSIKNLITSPLLEAEILFKTPISSNNDVKGFVNFSQGINSFGSTFSLTFSKNFSILSPFSWNFKEEDFAETSFILEEEADQVMVADLSTRFGGGFDVSGKQTPKGLSNSTRGVGSSTETGSQRPVQTKWEKERDSETKLNLKDRIQATGVLTKAEELAQKRTTELIRGILISSLGTTIVLGSSNKNSRRFGLLVLASGLADLVFPAILGAIVKKTKTGLKTSVIQECQKDFVEFVLDNPVQALTVGAAVTALTTPTVIRMLKDPIATGSAKLWRIYLRPVLDNLEKTLVDDVNNKNLNDGDYKKWFDRSPDPNDFDDFDQSEIDQLTQFQEEKQRFREQEYYLSFDNPSKIFLDIAGENTLYPTFVPKSRSFGSRQSWFRVTNILNHVKGLIKFK
jgi:hypothetical protein